MGPMDEAMMYLVTIGIFSWMVVEAAGHLYFGGDWQAIKDFARHISERRRIERRRVRRLRARH